MHHFLAAVLLVLTIGAPFSLAEDKPAPQTAEGGRILFQNVCAQCHGPKGEGNAQIKSPSIASLPDWYVKAQIENFRADRRGFHPQDIEGQLMRAITKVLQPEQVAAVAEFVSKMPRITPQPTIKDADLAMGKDLFEERCMECHRFNGEGELAFGAAQLMGLQDWYLAAELKKFKSGMRGAIKDDANGQKMVFSSGFVENEKMLQSVVAYILTLNKDAGQEKPEIVFGR
jgi:cbb3-type cytochrome c oxidase subunit III